MKRLPLLQYDELDDEQKNLHDEILSGPRTRIAGPMHVWFLNPEYGSLIQKVGAYCRFRTSLEPRLSELAIIVVARFWNADVEWATHSKIAAENGISAAIINSIENNTRPNFENMDEELIYELTNSILQNKGISDKLFEKASDKLGKKTLLELTAIVGYYSNIAIQLNVFQIPSADGKKIKDLNYID